MGHGFPMAFFVSFVKHRKLGTISFPRSFFSKKVTTPTQSASKLWSTESLELSLFPDPFSQKKAPKKVTTPTRSASELWSAESSELSLFPDPFSQKKAPKKSDNTHKVCLWKQEQSICEWKWASRFSYLSMYFVPSTRLGDCLP
jgi:hypothetical protein